MRAGSPNNQKLRVFVAAPDDVKEERERVHAVANELSRTGNIADQLGLSLEVLDWRTHVASAMGRPEGEILKQLPVEIWDYFVGIMWARFGSPTGGIDDKTGLTFDSGTEEEFTLAHRAWKEHKRPEIMFYRCMRDIPIEVLNAGFEQYAKVQKFFDDFKADKSHQGFYNPFQTTEDFERRIRVDLTKRLFDYRKRNCHLCNSARLPSSGSYLLPHQKTARIVKNVPADVCQHCGEPHFDFNAIAALRKIDLKNKKHYRTSKLLVYDFAALTNLHTRGKNEIAERI